MTHEHQTAAIPHAGPSRVGVVGRGRLGITIAAALAQAGVAVDGPAGRGEVPSGEAILLCVPDSELEAAARSVVGTASLVGHTSGATPLTALEPAARAGAEVFGLHPLQTFPEPTTGRDALELFRGVGCAVAGSTPGAVAPARALAEQLGMHSFEISDEGRAAYHAAASIASNFLITLEAAAEDVAAGAGLAPQEARRLLAPLVRRTVEGWATLGPRDALTGPVARGDEATVSAQREAVAEVAPEVLDLFDELLERTRAVAAQRVAA